MTVKPVSVGRALSLGLSQAVTAWPATLMVFLTLSADVFGGLLLSAALPLWMAFGASAGGSAVGGAVTSFLVSQLLRVLVWGGALRQGGARMAARPVAPFALDAVVALRRTLPFACWAALLELVAWAWRWLVITSTGWAYGRALVTREHGLVASGAFSLGLVLLAPAAIALSLWWRAALVRAVERDEPVLVSFFEAAGALWQRPFTYLGVATVTAVLGTSAELVFAAMIGPMTQSGPATGLVLPMAGQAVAGLMGGFVWALVELGRLQAFLALELDRGGHLPPEPEQTTPVIPTAQLILDAALLPDPPAGAPSGGLPS